MKLASIVPVKNIEHTFDGQYAMLLAHLKEHYPVNSVARKNCYTIMDNSLIELGGAVDIDTVYEAAIQCDADEMILPDVFREGYETYHRVYDDIIKLRDRSMLGTVRLMAVCHGRTLREFEECFKLLERKPEIHCIGIPKVAAELRPRDGRPGLEYVWQGSSKCIHLLGCTTNLDELRQYRHPTWIRSVDTCIPALLSKSGSDAWVDRPSKTIDLINDEINEVNYAQIMLQLRKEKLV